MSSAMMTSLLLVAAGGAAGSVLRYLVGQVVVFPLGTMAVNVIGSFVIGIAWVTLAGRDAAYLLLVTGFLGGFTTFSAFSLDTFRLVEDGRMVGALGYAGGTVVLSLAACLAGLAIARAVTA
jgi:CrcB protein